MCSRQLIFPMNNFLVQNEIIFKKALLPFLHVKKEIPTVDKNKGKCAVIFKRLMINVNDPTNVLLWQDQYILNTNPFS